MVATELITGIEELVNHIRELEMKNKKLEEDLKTQTTRADAWEKSYQDKCSVDQEEKYQPKGSRIDPEGLHDYMKEEIEKLREENKKLKEEKDHFAISMIKNTRQNYDEWKKETESVAIELIRLDLERAEEENKQLKEKLERVTSVRDDFAHTCATLNTALDIVDHNGVVSITKEELDENIESRGEPDNDKLVKILYEFYEVDED